MSDSRRSYQSHERYTRGLAKISRVDSSCGRSLCIIYIHWNYVSYYSLFILSIVIASRYQTGSVLSHFIDKLVSSEYMFCNLSIKVVFPDTSEPHIRKIYVFTSTRITTQDSEGHTTATGARCVRKKQKKKYIILQGGELTCSHFFKSSC